MSALTWYPAQESIHPSGVALVLHGLNQHPDRMQPLVDCLTATGVECLALSLRGHGDNFLPLPGLDPDDARLESFRRVSYGLWQAEVMAAYTIARTRSEQLGAPLLLAAFSLGGLLGCALAATQPDVRFDRMVLIAPALTLRPWGRLPLLLARSPRTVIPSVIPPDYRANRGTPVAAYRAPFAARHALRRAGIHSLTAPALIFSDQADELVSYAGLTRLATRLPSWNLYPIRKTGHAAGAYYHHLVIGAPAAGQAAWQEITERITAFIKDAGRVTRPA